MKKVFIGYVEIAGYYHHLSHGLREIGYSVDEYYYESHKFQYDPKVEAPRRIFRKLREARQAYMAVVNYRFDMNKAYLLASYLFYGNLFFAYMLFSYDVFILSFGSSIFSNNKELKFLKVFGKTIITNIAHGSEARPPYLNGVKLDEQGKWPSLEKLVFMTQIIKGNIRSIEKYSDYVIGAPLTSQLLERQFVNYFSLGLPNPSKKKTEKKQKVDTISHIRILHSPSNPQVKGTAVIRTVIDDLKKAGYQIDYVEVINRPNIEVMDEILKCDFVIDQLYSDSPLATFATEAAFLGKPAIIGGYGWEELKKWIPKNEFPVGVLIEPSELYCTVEKLILDYKLRKDLGEAARNFVLANWDRNRVATKYDLLIKGEVPSCWMLNPTNICYIMGVGLSKEKALENLKSIFDQYDDLSLGIIDKPYLRLEIAKQLRNSKTLKIVY